MRRYRLSVCKGPDCTGNGSDGVYARATEVVKRLGLEGRCELGRGGCYGLCHLGANVVVRDGEKPADPFGAEDFQLMGTPDEVYYWRMTPERIEAVLQEHVANDRPVEALRGDPDQPEAPTTPSR